ncbi:MAG TPA: MFS transporter [Candidatus Limnocylindria bacterium]|nr:MFS transporter [Candidatus Limnocylindria bacterium]
MRGDQPVVSAASLIVSPSMPIATLARMCQGSWAVDQWPSGRRSCDPMMRTLRSRPAFAWVAYAFLVTMMGTTLPSPLYPIYEQRFGFGELMVTVIFATYAVGVVAGLVLTGRLSDEVGRRPVLLFGLACAAAAAILFIVAQGVAPMLVARVLSGLSAGAFTGTATAALLDLAPGRRQDVPAALAVAVNLGGLGCGTLLSGALAQTGVTPLRLPFWANLALLAPATLGVLMAPEPVSARSRPRFMPQRLGVPREVRGTFIRASLGGFSSFAISGLFGSVAPVFLAKFLGYGSHLVAGAILAMLFLASAGGQLAVRTLPERAALVGGGAAVTAAACLVVSAFEAESLALVIAAGIVGGVGQGLAVGAGVAAVSAETPPERRGEVSASFFAVLYVGLCIPIVGVGVLSHAAGLRTAAVTLGAVVAAMAAAGAVSLVTRERAVSRATP